VTATARDWAMKDPQSLNRPKQHLAGSQLHFAGVAQ
jgi:hypothetical protein